MPLYYDQKAGRAGYCNDTSYQRKDMLAICFQTIGTLLIMSCTELKVINPIIFLPVIVPLIRLDYKAVFDIINDVLMAHITIPDHCAFIVFLRLLFDHLISRNPDYARAIVLWPLASDVHPAIKMLAISLAHAAPSRILRAQKVNVINSFISTMYDDELSSPSLTVSGLQKDLDDSNDDGIECTIQGASTYTNNAKYDKLLEQYKSSRRLAIMYENLSQVAVLMTLAAAQFDAIKNHAGSTPVVKGESSQEYCEQADEEMFYSSSTDPETWAEFISNQDQSPELDAMTRAHERAVARKTQELRSLVGMLNPPEEREEDTTPSVSINELLHREFYNTKSRTWNYTEAIKNNRFRPEILESVIFTAGFPSTMRHYLEKIPTKYHYSAEFAVKADDFSDNIKFVTEAVATPQANKRLNLIKEYFTGYLLFFSQPQVSAVLFSAAIDVIYTQVMDIVTLSDYNYIGRGPNASYHITHPAIATLLLSRMNNVAEPQPALCRVLKCGIDLMVKTIIKRMMTKGVLNPHKLLRSILNRVYPMLLYTANHDQPFADSMLEALHDVCTDLETFIASGTHESNLVFDTAVVELT